MKDMLESLPVSKSAVSWYLGELKSQKAFNVLRLSHVALRDCNEDGELLAEKVDNIVLVEALRCKTETGNVNHILNCLKCNPAADTYRECLSENVVSKEDILKSLASCIHTAAVGKLKLKLQMEEAEFSSSENEIDIQQIMEQPHVSAVFASGSYGLVKCDIARGGKRGKCHGCHSINCPHAQVWNEVERPSRVIWKPVKVSVKNKKNENKEPEIKREENIPKKKISLPPSQADVNLFHELAEQGHQYSN